MSDTRQMPMPDKATLPIPVATVFQNHQITGVVLSSPAIPNLVVYPLDRVPPLGISQKAFEEALPTLPNWNVFDNRMVLINKVGDIRYGIFVENSIQALTVPEIKDLINKGYILVNGYIVETECKLKKGKLFNNNSMRPV